MKILGRISSGYKKIATGIAIVTLFSINVRRIDPGRIIGSGLRSNGRRNRRAACQVGRLSAV